MDRSIQDERPRTLVTVGDPRGVGPELVVRAVAEGVLPPDAEVFGPPQALERAVEVLRAVMGPRAVGPGVLDGLRIRATSSDPDREAGAVQVEELEAVVAAAMENPANSVVVTGPITKYDAQQAGFAFVGQTEFLADRAGVERVVMLMAGPRLKVCLATTHLAIADLPAALDQDTVATTIEIAALSMARDFGLTRPRIGVCGLNPHAGERGRFGSEDMDIIAPAIEQARAALERRGMLDVRIAGPLPADTIFWLAVEGKYDLVVAMYHDQGLVAAKVVDFQRTVNVTLGLPFVRTSPDHGPARDLALTGRADPQSFFEAVRLGRAMWERRTGLLG